MRFMGMVSLAVAFATATPAGAQVLGPCGTPDADKSISELAAPPAAPASAMPVASVPLPGQQAPNFELPAVVGDDVKTIKLSDYAGKWRVVCFYPADFTFV